MKCPECGKNMVAWTVQGICAQKFEWKCRCKDKQWESEEEKEIFRQLWGEVNPVPCPDCEGTGHIVRRPHPIELGKYAEVQHCPRCEGSGEVVQG